MYVRGIGGGRGVHALLTLLCLYSCHASPNGPKPGEEINCPDGTKRLAVECNSVASLKQRVYNANVGLPSLGLGFSGSYQETAIGQITDTTQQLALNLQHSCTQYNACAIKPEEWREVDNDVRVQLARHVDLVGTLSRAPTEINGESVYSNALPAAAQARLELSYRVEVRPKGTSEFRVHRDGEPARSGDDVRFVIHANQPAYVYLLLLNSQGRAEQIFPLPDIGLKNPLPAQSEVHIPPSAEGTFTLDDTTGTEHLQIVASRAQLADIERRLAALGEGAGQSKPVLEGVGDLLCEGTRARGLTFTPTSVVCGGLRARGMTFNKAAGATVAAASEAIRARPADSVVAMQHAIAHQ